jgi:hypothetical protein
MAQALLFINGELINRKVAAEGGLVARLMGSGKSDGQVLDELYWSAFGRAPRPAERASDLATIRKALAAAAAPPAGTAAAGAPKPATSASTAAAVKLHAAAQPAQAPAAGDKAAPDVKAQVVARRHVFEDMFWVLLNSKEFLFNH